MPSISQLALLLISIAFLFGCEPVKKESYLLDEPITWHTHEIGDKNTYAYLNLENEQFGDASYTWSPALSDQPPADFGNITYLVEENSFDTQADGFMRARFFGQSEDGSLILYGFRTKGGTYWIKNSEDNTYGISYLPISVVSNEDTMNVDGTIIHCKELICNSNVGNITLSISYEGLVTQSTPLAIFEAFNLLINGSLNIFTSDEDITINNYIETLSIYPPLGVIRRVLDQGVLDNAIYVEMKLSRTNIDTSAFTKETTIE